MGQRAPEAGSKYFALNKTVQYALDWSFLK
jgi:hypothetical protein